MTRHQDDPAAPLRVEILRGDPTPEDVAAVIAVVTETYEAEAAAATAPPRRPSAWRTAGRALRSGSPAGGVPWGH